MIDKEKVVSVVRELLEGSDKFLVEVNVSVINIVDVTLDGDQGITIGECASLSRRIEAEFDRDLEDYELRVSSPGLDKPFVLHRQFKKYINRPIRIELTDGQKWKGVLLAMNEEGIQLERIVDKKSKETEKSFIPFGILKLAKPEIVFK
ncbi:MAG: ribosome assembly cofactor RimP [Bacteroidales bacterium]